MIPKEPYNLDPAFEAAVVTLAASRPRFWARVGHALDPDCLGSPAARLALQAVGLLARERGVGPASSLLTQQRVSRMVADGKITHAELVAVADLFDAAEDVGLPPDDAAADELAPILKRRAQSAAIVQAHDLFARKADLRPVVDALARADRLGAADATTGTLVGADSFDEIASMSSVQRLPTGVLELDLQLNDGLARRCFGVVLGASGDGKSQFLINQAAEGVRSKLFVGFGTLELPKPVQLARFFANMTGVPFDLIMENPADRAEAKRRMAIMTPYVGACVMEEFPPHATTVRDIGDWCDRVADQYGRRFDLLCLDYADKMHDPRARADNTYLEMRYVYEGVRRDLAVDRDMWVWTGAQAARADKDSKKRLELNNVSDSMHKVRVADMVITLNARDEGTQMIYFVAKNRLGKSRFQVGPLPSDFERARLVPAPAEFFDWRSV